MTVAIQNKRKPDETTLTSKSCLKLSIPLSYYQSADAPDVSVLCIYKDAAVGLFVNALDIHCCFWCISADQIACFADFCQNSVSFTNFRDVFLGTVQYNN